MPFGLHLNKPVEEVPSPYLLWVISRDAVRHKRPELVDAIIHALAPRFLDPAVLAEELRVQEPPPERWKTPEQIARRAAEKKAKRLAWEKACAEEREAFQAELKARWSDKKTGWIVKPPAADDGSDLV